MLKTRFSLNLHFFFSLLFLLFSLSFFPQSTYAACKVDGTPFNTNSADIGNPITLVEIGGWDADGDGDDITTCDVSHLTSLAGAFSNNTSFNQDISSWDVSNVTNFSFMFRSARAFNQDISSWDVSSATNMNSMFRYSVINQDISSWNVYNVTDMGSMFRENTIFNQDIRAWDTTSVTTYASMFTNATAMASTFTGITGFGDTPTSAFFNGNSESLNTAPVANAGPDQTVYTGATVTLDGTGSSDADSNSLTYAWTQTSGTSVTLSSSTASQPTFTAPTAASTTTLIFSLVVTDSIGDASSADTVTITVNLGSTAAFNQVKSEIDTLVNDAAFTSMQNHHQVTNTLSSAAVNRAMNNSCGTFKDQYYANVNSNSETSTAEGKITWSSIKDTSRYVKHQSIEFIHRDLEDGPNTSHLSFTLQWEDCTRDSFLWGYFAGVQAENSDLENSTFTDGEYNSTGLKVGSYFVKSLHQNAYWNGIISAPYNFNKMTLNTSLMHASSHYETKMISAGTGLTGKIAYKFITFKPNVNLRYSSHQSERVKFIASVGSQQSDNFIDLDRLEQITLRVRPSFILALNQSSPEFTPATLTIDPELSCDQKVVGTNTQRCTQGISIGLTQIFSNDVEFSLETGVQSNNDRNTHHFRTNIQIPF